MYLLLLFFVQMHLWLYTFLLYHFNLLCCVVAAFAYPDLGLFVSFLTLSPMSLFSACSVCFLYPGCECVIFSVGFLKAVT